MDSVNLFSQDDKFKKELVKWETEKEKGSEARLSLPIGFDSGLSVAVACLFPIGENFLVLKENGCLQLWNSRHAEIVNRVFLNETVSSLLIS